MGKVLGTFTNGFTGAVSRSIDNIIVSMKNGSGGEIPFGAPVFLAHGENACRTFDAQDSAAAAFLGFAARGALVTGAGAEDTTLALPNVTVRTASDSGNRAEVVLSKRNIL